VIAFRGGSVAEIIDEGVTGFIVENVEQAVQAVQRALLLDRRACRERFLERFTAQRMCEQYLAAYELRIREMKAPSTATADAHLLFNPGVLINHASYTARTRS
jgi:hypothetical protein